MLSAEQILQATQAQVQRVSTPEWGGHVHVRMLSGAEADAVQTLLGSSKDKSDPQRESRSMAGIVVLCCCDEQGQRTFRDDQVEQVRNLALAPLMRVATAALNLNGLSAAAAEGLEKN
jgi:hypothetical protein